MENIELNETLNQKLNFGAPLETNLVSMLEKTRPEEIPRDDLSMIIEEMRVNEDLQEFCANACNASLA